MSDLKYEDLNEGMTLIVTKSLGVFTKDEVVKIKRCNCWGRTDWDPKTDGCGWHVHKPSNLKTKSTVTFTVNRGNVDSFKIHETQPIEQNALDKIVLV